MAQTLGFSGNGDPCNLVGIWERTPPVSPSPDRISRIYRCPCFGGLALILRAGKAHLKRVRLG